MLHQSLCRGSIGDRKRFIHALHFGHFARALVDRLVCDQVIDVCAAGVTETTGAAAVGDWGVRDLHVARLLPHRKGRVGDVP